jgi:hypothetical protein
LKKLMGDQDHIGENLRSAPKSASAASYTPKDSRGVTAKGWRDARLPLDQNPSQGYRKRKRRRRNARRHSRHFCSRAMSGMWVGRQKTPDAAHPRSWTYTSGMDGWARRHGR